MCNNCESLSLHIVATTRYLPNEVLLKSHNSLESLKLHPSGNAGTELKVDVFAEVGEGECKMLR